MRISSRIRNRRSLRKTGTWPDEPSWDGFAALQAWAALDDTAPTKRKDRILHLVKKHRRGHASTSTSLAKYNRKRERSSSVISKPSIISSARPKHEPQNETAIASRACQPTNLPETQPMVKPTTTATGPSVAERVSSSTFAQHPPSVVSLANTQRSLRHKFTGLDAKFCSPNIQCFTIRKNMMHIGTGFTQCDFISSNGERFMSVLTPRRRDRPRRTTRTTLVRGAQGPMFSIQEDWHYRRLTVWGPKPDIYVFDMQSKVGKIQQPTFSRGWTITFRNSARTGNDGSKSSGFVTLKIADSFMLRHTRVMMDHKNEQGVMVEEMVAQCTMNHFTFKRKGKMEVRAGVDVALIAAFVGWVSNERALNAGPSSSPQVMLT